MRKVFKKVCVGVLSLSMIFSGLPFLGGISGKSTSVANAETGAETVVPDTTSEITIDGDNVRADNVNGLTYKGFGFLSANSTSDLLLDYKSQYPEEYVKLMQYLFGGDKPIMTHVKLEMGNDRNNSTGSESSTKRLETEETNILRNPGWQIAADAKKINPDIKVSILRWNNPKWANTTELRYKWYKEAILQAYEKYGYMVDYINPCVNEKWDEKNDKQVVLDFNQLILDETADTISDKTALELYKKIKFVVSDEAEQLHETIAESVINQDEFGKTISVLGYHYPNEDTTGVLPKIADELDYEVWSSENQATFSDSNYRPLSGTGIGGAGSALEMGNFIVKGFTESRRTHIVYQPAVASFYEGGQYSYKELVSARDPWSGWMHYDAGLLVLKHLSNFAVTGWENETNTAGIWRAVVESSKCEETGTRNVDGMTGADSYLTLAAPDKSDFSTIFVNNSALTKEYKISVKNLKVSHDAFEVWETRAADDGAYNENYMKLIDTVEKDDSGVYTVVVKPYSIVTVTSLENKDDASLNAELPTDGERVVLDTDKTGDTQDTSSEYLYADDFAYEGKTVPVLGDDGNLTSDTEDYVAARGGDTGFIARYTNNLNGSFEGYKTSDGNYVLRQQLDGKVEGKGSAWNTGDALVVIGDYRWTNYKVSTDVLFEDTTMDESYASLVMRQTYSKTTSTNSGYTFKITSEGSWTLSRNNTVVAEGIIYDDEVFKKGFNAWNNLILEGKGNVINAYVNRHLVTSYEDETPITFGRIGLGSNYTHTQFDNLEVRKLNGYAPYLTELTDNMVTHDLTSENNAVLVYNDKWSHQCAQGMYVNQRSISNSAEEGATLSYKFTGSGFEISGASDSQEKTLKITVDGEVVDEKYVVSKVDNFQTSVVVNGLNYGEHEFTIEVLSGTFSVDSVGIYGEKFEGDDDSDYDEPYVQPAEPPTPSTEEPVEPTPTEQAVPAPQQQQLQQASAPTGGAASAATPAATTTDGTTFTTSGLKYTVVSASELTVNFSGLEDGSTVTKVTIPATVNGSDGKTYKVVGIANGALSGNKKVKKVIIGANVKSIGSKAFFKCKNLKNIILKTKILTKVGAKAIKGINKKAVIKCPKGKKKIYKKLFKKKTGFVKSMKVK